ncbi:hypothetical protein NDU88_004955 [Pleurodeles waltl]|uniref:Uncharacterized protein n=1 Tax=Pleurodeles waltl TaxID=8319 RepID=A0AAV7NQ04_PLEWA|nr:hypothetical protein NDU88_004955 [Pleurodeles waltl]
MGAAVAGEPASPEPAAERRPPSLRRRLSRGAIPAFQFQPSQGSFQAGLEGHRGRLRPAHTSPSALQPINRNNSQTVVHLLLTRDAQAASGARRHREVDPCQLFAQYSALLSAGHQRVGP